MRLTWFERVVLQRVAERRDPWDGRSGSTGSRPVSQALGRLEKKGAITGPPWRITDAARPALSAWKSEET